jgi:DNA-3-methyladenine glycosylase
VPEEWSALGGSADVAAKSLLGCTLTGNGVRLRLTEVEAYGDVGTDPASHAHRGRTPRNAVMFGPAGYAYVYFTYGMHWCVNVVCGPVGAASAVLLRAGEVIDGLDVARRRRPAARRDRDLASGPARLALVMAADRGTDGTFLLGGGPLTLHRPARPVRRAEIASGPRVGITVEVERPWRFWLAGEPSVSTYRVGVRRQRTRAGSAAVDEGQSGT